MVKGFLTLTLCSSTLLFAPIAFSDLSASHVTTPAQDLKKIPEYTIVISNPADQQTITTAADTVDVSVTVTPDLAEKDTVTIHVDGTQALEPIHATTLTIPRLDPGTHTLQAKVIQPDGKGAESATITVFQQRISGILLPKNPAPMAPKAKMAP